MRATQGSAGSVRSRLVMLAAGVVLLGAACVGTIAEGSGESSQAGDQPGQSERRPGVTTPGSAAPGTPGGDLTMPSAAGTTPSAGAAIDFFRDIQPILGDHCVRCHGGVRELGNLNLHTKESAMRVLGTESASLLLVRVTMTDPKLRMPLGTQPLPPESIDKLRRWIAQGAPWPTHWAFAPLREVTPSQVAVRDETWVRSPIDRFVLSRLEREGLKPSREADRPTLIRRLRLDLTGLPPTPKEVDDFVADSAPDAYEKLVDRLLKSSAFGERWARHWLDQARYAESDGYEKDLPRPNAWRWRDWVIAAINDDMPFDQFTVEQVAGDLLPGATPAQVLATGFHRNTLYNREGGIDPEEFRVKRAIDRIATVANVWLGLSLQCAQCHSHAYDRIAQKEFYRMYAFFNNVDEPTTQVPMTADPAETRVMNVDIVRERTQNRRQTYLFVRGDFLNPDKAAGALTGGTLGALHPFVARGPQPDRLDLARWLVDPKNALTARVTVNTIWYYLFGQGIVTSLGDFGSRSAYPSHPELLDYLARDFVQNGWRRKRVVKQIVMSATYRQASALRQDAMVKDPSNALVHRQNRVRVEAEIVTDLNLAAAGLLSTRVGGPSVYPPLPNELREIIKGAYSNYQWVDSTGPDRYRRGMYTFHKRQVPHPNLKVFDAPAAEVSVTGRGRSNTPLQALTTLHNVMFDEAAQAFARRVQTEKPAALRDQLIWAIRIALARTPTDAELKELEGLYVEVKRWYEANPAEAPKAVGASFAAPAGVAPSDAAAWVATARVILNLDEFITRE